MKGGNQLVYLLTLVFGYIAVATYPYAFLKNHAKLTAQTAIFEKPGILVWDGQTISPETQRIIISMNATPYSTNQEGPARIVTISRDHYHSNITIGQRGSDLIIRLRRDSINALGLPPFVVPRIFESLAPQRLEVAVNKDSLTVKVNGDMEISQKLADNPFQFWDANYSLALGNEHTWQRPWIGEVNAVQLTVDTTTINIMSSDSISKPGIIHLLRQRLILFSPSVVDWIVNFVAMLPIGALTASIFSRHRIAWSLGFWSVMAATVETAQALIPTRYPAISDLVLNATGAGAGAWLLVWFSGVGQCRRKPKSTPAP